MSFGEEEDTDDNGAGEDLSEETDQPEEAGRGLHGRVPAYRMLQNGCG